MRKGVARRDAPGIDDLSIIKTDSCMRSAVQLFSFINNPYSSDLGPGALVKLKIYIDIFTPKQVPPSIFIFVKT